MVENKFVRFINCSIPVTGCNLRCDYCYLIQQGNEKLLDFKETREGFLYPVDYMASALTPERMGGICAFHICGNGETLLWVDIVEFAKKLLELGHFVSFTSNCTITKKILEFISFPKEYKERMFFKCSFHYREFKRLGLLERFAQNVNYLANAGISYTVEIVTNDYVINNLDEIKEFSIKNFGELPHILTQRSELIKGKYPRMDSILNKDLFAETWGQFNSALFAYQQKTFDIKHNEFCYAGVYSLQMNLENGDVYPCPGNNKRIINLFEDPELIPQFVPVGHNCPLDNCFFSFVTHIMGGCDRELKSDVYFSDFRNRKRMDNGKCWLSETMNNAYSHRCSEFHERLSENQEFFVDMLMRVIYGTKELSKEEWNKCVRIVDEKLTKFGYRRVIIYGLGAVGEWFKDIIKFTNVELVCGIDRRFDSLQSDIKILSPLEDTPDADVVIVTAYSDYHKIYKLMKNKVDIPIISIVDMV